MVLRRIAIIGTIGLAIAAVRSFAVAVGRAADQLVDAIMTAVALPSEMRFATETPEGYVDLDGDPLDPVTQQFLRHEAGYSRRAAPRHC